MLLLGTIRVLQTMNPFCFLSRLTIGRVLLVMNHEPGEFFLKLKCAQSITC